MGFVKKRDFVLYHDIVDGVESGWTIAFALHHTPNRGNIPHVWATSPTGRTIRDPKRVAKIFPVEDWPEFARKTLTQPCEDTQGRLF